MFLHDQNYSLKGTLTKFWGFLQFWATPKAPKHPFQWSLTRDFHENHDWIGLREILQAETIDFQIEYGTFL